MGDGTDPSGAAIQADLREDMDACGADAARQVRDQGHALVAVPGGGLHVDRPLPFLCVYRRPIGGAPAGAERLVLGQAAHLVVSGAPDLGPAVRSLIERLALAVEDTRSLRRIPRGRGVGRRTGHAGAGAEPSGGLQHGHSPGGGARPRRRDGHPGSGRRPGARPSRVRARPRARRGPQARRADPRRRGASRLRGRGWRRSPAGPPAVPGRVDGGAASGRLRVRHRPDHPAARARGLVGTASPG